MKLTNPMPHDEFESAATDLDLYGTGFIIVLAALCKELARREPPGRTYSLRRRYGSVDGPASRIYNYEVRGVTIGAAPPLVEILIVPADRDPGRRAKGRRRRGVTVEVERRAGDAWVAMRRRRD